MMNHLGKCEPCSRERCKTCKIVTYSETDPLFNGARVKLKGETNNLLNTKCGLFDIVSGNPSPTLNITNGHRGKWRHETSERSPVA